MIKRLMKHKISLLALIAGIPFFVRLYVSTRQWSLLFRAVPGLLGTVLLVADQVTKDSATHQQHLQRRYHDLSQAALEDGAHDVAELYFARQLELTDNPQAVSFAYAKQLYNKSNAAVNPCVTTSYLTSSTAAEAPDAFATRSLALLRSLAPRRDKSRGHAPAHMFLADHFETRRPQSPVTELLALQHRVSGMPDSKNAALDLARFLTAHNYHQLAIESLNRWQVNCPDVKLTLAIAHSRLGQDASAQRQLDSATQQLTSEINRNPTDIEARQQLSQVLGAQGRILESLFVLAEGYRQIDDVRLADQLIQRYTLWLSGMPVEKVRRQLDKIQQALAPASTPPKNLEPYKNTRLTRSNGHQTSLPSPIISLHNALLNGDGQWLVPLLLGTDKAVVGDLAAAVTLLEEANAAYHNHPVIENNLAWVLWRQTNPAKPATTDAAETSATNLLRAWELSNAAFEVCPENQSFRETRGLLAAATGRWQMADGIR